MDRQQKPNAGAAPFVIRADPIVKPLIPGYLANRRKDLDRIRDSLAKGDFGTLRVIGHDLKGSGGAYGIPPLSELGGRLETAALANDAAAIAQLRGELEAFLDGVTVA